MKITNFQKRRYRFYKKYIGVQIASFLLGFYLAGTLNFISSNEK
jgi:hypothetical protein